MSLATPKVRALRRRMLWTTFAGLAGLMAGACAIEPEPLDRKAILQTAREDMAQTLESQPAVEGPISLAEAQARAVLYNLDHRTEMMKEALARGQVELAKLDMLPTLAASAGWRVRSVTDASSSESIVTGQESLEPSTSQDDARGLVDLRLSWNVLDFGVSYYAAKQEANRYLISQEARERVLLNLLQQVRTAYWRAAAARIMAEPVKTTLAEAEQALDQVQANLDRGLGPLQQNLELKRALLSMIGQLQTVSRELALARIDLARLMNIPPGQDYRLDVPERTVELPQFNRDIAEMELLALQNSNDIAASIYSLKVEQAEARKSILRLLPGLELSVSGKYDSNSFLAHNLWGLASARVSSNLLRLASVDETKEQNRLRESLAKMRRKAVTMAAITQVHLAYRRYVQQIEGYDNVRELESVERRIAELTEQASIRNAASEVDRVRTRVQALRAELARLRTFAEAQDALGMLFVSLGLNPVPPDYARYSFEALTARIRERQGQWNAGELPAPVQLADAAES